MPVVSRALGTPIEYPRNPRSTAFLTSASRRQWHHIGFVCVAVVLLYCIVHAFDPPRVNWGDSNSDYNVMVGPELRPVRFPELL